MTGLQIAAAAIVALTPIGVAIGRWPWLKMNRATVFGVVWLSRSGADAVA